MGVRRTLECVHHALRNSVVANDVSDGTASITLGGGMDRGDLVTMEKPSPPVSINYGKLAPSDRWIIGSQRVNDFRRGFTFRKQFNPFWAEPVIRPILYQYGADTGFRKRASRADVHVGCCHRSAEHPGSPAHADQ
jgi:hypothetical protein